MRVTKWGEYGILCSVFLAKKGMNEPVGAQEISETQDIPLQYTQQILQRLRKGGIIKSVRGPHGGYALTRAPEQTTLKDILYAAEGDTFELICATNPIYPEKCAHSPCGLHLVWSELKVTVDKLLESKTLAWVVSNDHSAAAASTQELVQFPKATL